MQKKIIYSLRVMIELAVRGFQPIAIMPNPKDPHYNCWIYVLTPQLEEALSEVFKHEN